ncbi:ABC transporter substrate-binding protein [Campylobacter sp.]|uniref:ABC transporter substrate-binding protein n=1 Tax=Campylobacter sp. TaxID=205 RepID=UPI0025BE3B75|nr:ABC transporter substrate-binding protein [Campylobacter sp.]
MKKIVAFLLTLSCFLAASASAQAPKKLVVLDPSIVEMIYMLGADDQLVAISSLQFSKIWPEEKTAKLKSVGTYTKPNIEQIVELKPDLVVTSFHSANVNESLAKFNLKTLTLKADSVDDIYKNIEEIGKITGKEQKAAEVIEGIKTKFASFKSSGLKGKKILAVFSSTPLTGFSKKTLPGDIFNKLELKNIADDVEGSTPIVSTEFILSQNPDFILVIGGMGGGNSENFLKQNPVLKKTTAAKNDKVLSVPSSLLLRGTPRIGEAVDKIYELLSK